MKFITLVLLMTAVTAPALAQGGDSAFTLKPRIARYDYDAIPKDPLASAFFSATFPGTGQIYNKEYVRGVITGAGFYLGLYMTYAMLDRWTAINTDTFWIPETDPSTGKNTQIYHQVTAMKADGDQKGLPTDEKIVLGGALLVTAGCYIFGVVDSYYGARRYNTKLMAAHEEKLSIKMACSLLQEKVGLNALYRF